MSTVRFGILGCGVIADWHAKAILMSNGGSLVGAADVNYESAKNFAEKYEIKAFASPEEMLNSNEIDAVCICTPSGFHASCAIKTIEAGKHLLIEKPLAIKNEDCERIIKMAKEKGICAGVVSQLRFSSSVREVKKLIVEGKLGKIITADLLMKYYRSQEYYDSSSWRGRWELDGGSLMNQGIHGLDILLFLMGDVKRVFGTVNTLAHDMEAEDTATATIEFTNGSLAVVQSSTAVYNGYPRMLTISGTKGTVTLEDDAIIRCDLEDKNYTVKSKTEINGNFGFNDPKAISNDGHAMQIQDFIDALKNGTQPFIPLAEGYKSVRTINAIYSSSKDEKVVTIN